MYHRLVTGTGLGNPRRPLLDNKGKVNRAFAREAIKLYFEKWEGFDFHVDKDEVTVGIEPSYQYDPLKIVSIHKDKSKSYIMTGQAFGGYGSGIRSAVKHYADYRYKCKFTKFVDKWHAKFFGGKS